MKKRLLSVFLCLVIISASIVGCGGSNNDGTAAQSGESGTKLGGSIEVAVIYTDTKLETFQGIVDAFTEETGVAVDLIAPGSDYESQLRTMMASNTLPDVWSTHGWSLKLYSEYLQPVNDQPWFDSMDTEALAGVMEDENGNFYALDLSIGLSGLIYNADVLEEADVSLDDLTTWDGVIDACEKIKAIGVTPFVVGGAESGNLAGILGSIAPTFWTDEGAVVDGKTALLDGTFDFDTYGTELLEWFCNNFVKKGYLNKDALTLDQTGAQQALGAGEAAFLLRGPDNITVAKEYYPDANLGILPLPASQEGAKPSWRISEDNAFGVWKDTENPDAAWAFLEFLARPENAKTITEMVGTPSAIDGVVVDNSPACDAYNETQERIDGWCQYDNVFDRKYFPSGMWSAMGQTMAMTISNPDDVSEAVAFLKDNYISLYAAEHQ